MRGDSGTLWCEGQNRLDSRCARNEHRTPVSRDIHFDAGIARISSRETAVPLSICFVKNAAVVFFQRPPEPFRHLAIADSVGGASCGAERVLHRTLQKAGITPAQAGERVRTPARGPGLIVDAAHRGLKPRIARGHSYFAGAGTGITNLPSFSATRQLVELEELPSASFDSIEILSFLVGLIGILVF